MYYPYFIAGIFDSDGSISIKNSKKRVSIISTYEVLKYISEFISKKLDIKELKFMKVTDNKDNVYRLHLYKDSEKFIYNDENFSYLNRKYSIYSKMKSISGKNQTT